MAFKAWGRAGSTMKGTFTCSPREATSPLSMKRPMSSTPAGTLRPSEGVTAWAATSMGRTGVSMTPATDQAGTLGASRASNVAGSGKTRSRGMSAFS